MSARPLQENTGENEASDRRRSQRRPPPVLPEIIKGAKGEAGMHGRFKKAFPGINLDPTKGNSRGKWIDFDAAMESVNSIREQHGIAIETDHRPDISSRLPSSVAPLRSTRQQQHPDPCWRFFYDAGDFRVTGRLKLEMVQEDRLADEMLERGFVEVPAMGVYARNAKIEDLPSPRAFATDDTGASDNVPIWERPAPPDNKPPKMGQKVPALRKGGPGDDASKIVECFEEKVVDEESGEVLSPLRRWKDFTCGTGALNSRLCAYYAIKKKLEPDGTILKKMIRAAREAPEIQQKKADCATAKTKFSWFDVCVDLYENN